MLYLGVLGVPYIAIIDGKGAALALPFGLVNFKRPAINLISLAYGSTYDLNQRVSVLAGNKATTTPPPGKTSLFNPFAYFFTIWRI